MLTFYLSLLIDEPSQSKFEQLYRQYRHTMFWTAQRILQDQAAAEDAVHDAFLRILDHLEQISLENCNKTRAFIVIIVRNIALDMVRKRKKLAEADLEEHQNIPADRLSDPEQILLDHESSEAILQAIKKMKQIYVDILTLHVLYQYSSQDIARLLNLSPANVRVRLHRGRRQLAEILKEDD